MAQCTMDTPLGTINVVADEIGIRSLDFAIQKVEKNVYHTHFEQLKKELQEYFDGKRTVFNVPLNPSGTAFQRQVWQCLCSIPYGHTVSYTQEAMMLKHPSAVRAVANANGKNPLPILIPCHRVIAKDGSLGGYSDGLWRKEFLLNLEKAEQ